MTEDVETAAPGDTARAVAERMAGTNVGSLVVCDGNEPVGIVTESDLVRLFAREADVDAFSVEEFMSRDLIVVEPDTTVEDAARQLDEGDFRRLPVVVDGDLVGIVTATDLSYYLPRLLHRRNRSTPGEVSYRVRPDTTYEDENWEFESRTVSRDHPTVGDIVEFSKEITDVDVRQFAHASGDTNRLHLDEKYAAETRFGGRIVHGTLVSGVVSAALARLPGLTIYLSQEVSFLGPVHIGASVRAVCEIVRDLGGDKYLLSTDVYADDEQVIEGEAVVLVDELPERAHVEVEQLA